jgi:hypothetical protein
VNRIEHNSQLLIHIPLAAKLKAEEFRRYQSQPDKAKQVYLNTLAVWIVNLYLNTKGWITNLANSHSQNPILQTLLDAADLEILGYGKLECRVVLPNATYVEIPLEARSSRIACVAVGLNESLSQAKLLGFTSTLNHDRLALDKLNSIDKLTDFLRKQQQHISSHQPVALSQWWRGIFALDWQPLELLFPQGLTWETRNATALSQQVTRSLSPEISRVKILKFDQEDCDLDIALIIELFSPVHYDANIDVLVKICSLDKSQFLPVGLNSFIVDDTQNTIMQARCRDQEQTEIIEFQFSGSPGENFSIQISWNNCLKVENFVI